MKQSKSLASLTPRLLARKGTARPAMRPQLHEATARQLDEDLGFNDMGFGENEWGLDVARNEFVTSKLPITNFQAEVVELKPAASMPEVLRLQHQLAGRISDDTRRGASRCSALAEGRKAAFTLRLDADRHLELRLASTLAGRSAQQLLTEALDRMIESLPEVANLAARASKRN
jgi:hypothetical protein